MTDEDIKAGLALCEAATEGAWRLEAAENGTFVSAVGVVAKAYDPTDAEFIAQARTLLPEALRELERLRRVERAARLVVRDAGVAVFTKETIDALRTALEDA